MGEGSEKLEVRSENGLWGEGLWGEGSGKFEVRSENGLWGGGLVGRAWSEGSGK